MATRYIEYKNTISTEGKMEVSLFTIGSEREQYMFDYKNYTWFEKYNESTKIWISFIENEPFRIKRIKER